MTADPTTPPPPGAKRAALAEERAHVARVHDRVEELRERAGARALEAAADRSGSTFQARFERDVTAHHHATRAARLTFGDVESLVFGRLDTDDAEHLHVGRLSVVDDRGDVLLVDWRAPASAPFYQATPADPMGVARRRTLVTRGREVRDLDDEVLDAEAAERLGLQPVTGQGALLAALSRTRTPYMRDIVATIQADQDRIIRSPATGTLVVSGGPGTGKTVVALHRVAYLLYGDRDRFEGRGILVVGPSRAFTEYTARVLPALGEDRAVQRPLEGFAPAGVRIEGWDDLDVAGIKGDLAMVEVCKRAVAAAVPPLPPNTRISFEGTTAQVDERTLRKVRDRLLSRVSADRAGSTYHGRSAAADESLRAALWRAWRSAHRAAGGRPPDERVGTGFDAALDEAAQITMLRRCFWPPLDAASVLGAVADGQPRLADLGVLDPSDAELVQRAWAAADTWTVDDVPLLDEVAGVLGAQPEPQRQSAAQRDDEGIRLTTDQLQVEVEVADVDAPDYRDFAHVVVDEAQDLSPMQWRMVARRGPYASWTVVGDLAQRSRVAEPRTWDEVAALIGRREVAVRSLSVNYRTPAEVVGLARAVLEAAGHDPDSVPQAVRETGERPQLRRTEQPVDEAVSVAIDHARVREGTVAIVAPREATAALQEEVAARTVTAQELADRIRVFDPRTVKGLEFDDVIVVEPDVIATGSAVGMHQLYVAVTRATRSLTLVATPDAEVPGEHALQSR